ncbi:MAG: flagellar type III secretion system pore protein FliP [Polyangiaceae bacterium]|jgi:flagellar biosynthetic protein FliP
MKRSRLALGGAFVGVSSLLSVAARAAPTDLTALDPPGLSPQLKILAILTILSLLPAIVLTMTSFTRVIIVLGFVRQGLSMQQTPPTQVLVGLALFLTGFTMAPVFSSMVHDAYEPYSRGTIGDAQALERASAPLRSFMLHQTREADLALFYDVSGAPLPTTEEDVPIRIAAPAFVVSELTTAFQMGVLVLLPFLVIDMAVSSILMSLGMMMVPPTTISLPLKLLLFVTADGWHMLIGSLVRSFA